MHPRETDNALSCQLDINRSPVFPHGLWFTLLLTVHKPKDDEFFFLKYLIIMNA